MLPSLKKVHKRCLFKFAAVLDLILIALILIYGRQPAQSMVKPVVASFKTAYSSVITKKTTNESFAFVPGLARNKFDNIELEGLTHLSFFDVPLTAEGEINRDSRGYASFASSEAQYLFDRARYQKTKVLLTLSAFSANTIEEILNNPDARLRLADQIIEEIKSSGIEGVTLDFEYPYGGDRSYQEKFTNFSETLTKRIHASIPGAIVAVAVPSSNVKNDSLYDIEVLSKRADKIFLIASDFIVPEAKNNAPANPVFGYNNNQYWQKISNFLTGLEKRSFENRLVLERAWYGNGDKYPLYVPNNHYSSNSGSTPSEVHLDDQTIAALLAGVPDKGKEGARKNIPLIAQALSDEGILDSNVLAYALATIEHETDETFQPIDEIQGKFSARRLGYEGGANYFGRGFIQITHLRNYRKIGERIGMGENLVKNPELASVPKIAARVLAAFFKDNNVANLASQGNFVAARRPINPDYNGYSVANLAMKYELY